jgi:hypothetical protein
MTDDSFATRREFDMLVNRVDSMDRDGTRGVLALQAQLTDAIKDMVEIKSDLIGFKTDTAGWFKEHGKQHTQDQRERVSGRRWLVGTAFAGLMAMAAVIGLLIQVVQSVH